MSIKIYLKVLKEFKAVSKKKENNIGQSNFVKCMKLF